MIVGYCSRDLGLAFLEFVNWMDREGLDLFIFAQVPELTPPS